MTTAQTRVAIITFEAAKRWAADHGLDANDVAAAEIVIDGETRLRSGFMALVEFTVYKRNEDGHRYKDPDADEAAVDYVRMPLHSWPELRTAE